MNHNPHSERKRALVISGGGSKGAFAGGVAEYLIRERKYEYDILVGSSTGALLVPLISIGQIDRLKKYYTNITQEDIYNIDPFKILPGDNGEIKTKINHYNVIRMFLRKKKTFGESRRLRHLIRRFFTKGDYDEAKASFKKIIVTVSNITKDRLEYKYLSDYDYEMFCDWMWASTCFAPFMSMARIKDQEYIDGGFGNYIPVEEAVNNGAKDVDVIVLRPKTVNKHRTHTKNPFEVITKSMWFMLDQIVKYDLMIGYYQSIFDNDVNVNFIFTPYELTEHSYYFNPEQMKKWWQLGYDHAKNTYHEKR